MAKNPREPKAVKALIAKHTKAVKAQPPPKVIPPMSLWSKLRLRRSDSN